MSQDTKTILITGCAGFIGYHQSLRLLRAGYRVVGIDNLNTYYDVSLKQARLALLKEHQHFHFTRIDIQDKAAIFAFFEAHSPYAGVIHLAAQAGVRYAFENPYVYASTNLVGFLHVLEACVCHQVPHLLYASSSSVYGANTQLPFAESMPTETPVSLYAATKKSNELMAYAYAHLHKLPMTGLRFFTVYGPYGRPDMALFKFVQAILKNEPLPMYNHGNMKRDFTYVEDIVESVYRLLDKGAVHASESVPHRVFNIGNQHPVNLRDFISLVERRLGRSARIESMPMQKGDVSATYSDTSALKAAIGFIPNTALETGIAHFVDWYKTYYKTETIHS